MAEWDLWWCEEEGTEEKGAVKKSIEKMREENSRIFSMDFFYIPLKNCLLDNHLPRAITSVIVANLCLESFLANWAGVICSLFASISLGRLQDELSLQLPSLKCIWKPLKLQHVYIKSQQLILKNIAFYDKITLWLYRLYIHS